MRIVLYNGGNARLYGSPYSPLIDLVYGLYYYFWGIASEHELAVSIIFFAIALWGIYRYAAAVFSRKTGIIAALLFMALPAVLIFSKAGFLEFHVMCCVMVPLYFLVRSGLLQDGKNSIFFGVTAGLLIMLKWESFLFLVVPVLWTVVRIIQKEKRISAVFRWPVITAFLTCLAVGSFWYVLNKKVFFGLLMHRITDASHSGITLGLNNPFFYVRRSMPEFISPIYGYAGLLAGGLVILRTFFYRKDRERLQVLWMLMMSVAVPFGVYTVIQQKDATHLLPVLPFFSLIIAENITAIKNYFARRSLILLVIAHAILAPLIIFLPVKAFPGAYGHRNEQKALDFFFFTHTKETSFLLNATIAWDVILKNIITFVCTDYQTSGLQEETGRKKPRVMLIANLEPVRFWQLQYYNMKQGEPLALDGTLHGGSKDYYTSCVFGNRAQRKDYLIREIPYRSAHAKVEDRSFCTLISLIDNRQKVFNSLYEEVKRIVLPRNSELIIYRARDDVRKTGST